MPETLDYSLVVPAIHNLWRAARARGLGLDRVSILDPAELGTMLDVPLSWRFIALFCMGLPQSDADYPEVHRKDWHAKTLAARPISVR